MSLSEEPLLVNVPGGKKMKKVVATENSSHLYVAARKEVEELLDMIL